MDKLHVFPVQAGEIIRVHNSALAAKLRLRNQNIMVLLWCCSLEVRRLGLHSLLTSLLPSDALKGSEVALEVEEENASEKPHRERHIAENPFNSWRVFRIWSFL